MKLPQGCVKEWSAQANKDGYLDWDGFSQGLVKALESDATRLRKIASVQTPPTDAKRMLQGEGHGSFPMKGVECREIEEFLCRCEGRNLVQALAQARKEVYRCQMSLHQLAAEREEGNHAGEGGEG